MNSRTDIKTLRRLAAISPVKYRDQIRERNTKLLAALEQLWANRKNKPEAEVELLLGCPHHIIGEGCYTCMWWLVSDAPERSSCFKIPFSGYTLNAVEQLSFIRINYQSTSCSATIEMDECPPKYIPQALAEYRACKAFLMEHIRWCDEMKWGTEVGEG